MNISSLGLKEWLEIIAMLMGPIIAVLAGQYLQDRKAIKEREYNNKFSVFAYLLGNRHALGSNETFVVCINQIPIVFQKNSKVLAALSHFILAHRMEPYSGALLQSKLNDLVMRMAEDLGYKDMDNDSLETYFYPSVSAKRHQADSLRDESWLNNSNSSHRDYENPPVNTPQGLQETQLRDQTNNG